MLKKIELARNFLFKYIDYFQCPICHQDVKMNGYTLACQKRHQFDLSKKGTFYFLSNQVKSNYSRHLFEARRQMILSGMYTPLITELNSKISGDFILDVGTGEGSFLNLLIDDKVKIGFDIAKDGIAMASDYTSDHHFFCIADLTNLPFKNQTVDTILNIFTPSHYQEFQRVLKKGGKLIKVIPEENYLKELRLAYGQRTDYSNQKVINKFQENFNSYSKNRLTYTFDIKKERRLDMLEMSPLEWQVSKEIKENLKRNPLKQITIDVSILVGET